MHTNEFFPPTEAELEKIIAALKARLQDPAYEDEWIQINAELIRRETQLQTLIIQNNAL